MSFSCVSEPGRINKVNIAAVIKRGRYLYTQNYYLWRPQNEMVMSYDVGIRSLTYHDYAC